MACGLPDYAEPLFKPARYKALRGGRGSAKSYTVARLLLIKALEMPSLIVCGREYQNSIADSVHSLLSSQIDSLNFNRFFNVHNNYIETKDKKSKFIFKGLNRNIQSIKSTHGITDFWLEEAQTISATSWEIIIPTVREPFSEIWCTYNPENEDDPTHVKFGEVEGMIPPDDSIIITANWRDNPWFPGVLIAEKDHMFKTNPDLYHHIWEGEVRANSDAQILKNKWHVEKFEPQKTWDGPYFGADWGFSVDPMALVKMWIDVDKMNLHVEYETGGLKIDLPFIKNYWEKVPETKEHVIRADNARPETISFMCREGFNVIAAEKWSGSVEDGIEVLKSFNKIIIHPRCKETITECRKYKYKVDRLTGDITTKIEDAFNHRIDAMRYGLDPFISKKGMGLFNVL